MGARGAVVNNPGPTAVPQKRKKRPTKDPLQPKRSLSAYMFFANAKRDEVKEKAEQEGIKLTFGEVGKELGRLWGLLDENGKAEYEALAAQDKQRYEQEKAAYVPSPGF